VNAIREEIGDLCNDFSGGYDGDIMKVLKRLK
jgi:hypothetical protein